MKKNDKQLPVFFRSSLLLKIISLLSAILLWFYVSAVESPNSEKNIDAVAVTLRNRDVMMTETGLSVITDGIYEVNVVLSGKKSTLNKIDYEDIKATVDLSKLTEPGAHELPISVIAPPGTTLVSTNPRYVTVSIDKTISKSFEIAPKINMSAAADYNVGIPVITDTQNNALTAVTVSGPATEVDRVHRVEARIDFGSINSSAVGTTNLICYDINGDRISTSSVKLTPDSVKIKQPLYMTKTVPLKVTQSNYTFSDRQIHYKINPSSITITGDPKILEGIDHIQLDPINERDINETLTSTVNSVIKLPDDVKLEGTQNMATVTVNINNVNRQSFNITGESINVINKPDFLDITFTEANFNLILINASEVLIPLKNINLTLDLSGYSAPGIYTENIHPKFDEDLSYAYFPHEAGYAISFELSRKVEEAVTEETETEKAGE